MGSILKILFEGGFDILAFPFLEHCILSSNGVLDNFLSSNLCFMLIP